MADLTAGELADLGDKLMSYAKVAEMAERYQDMCAYMKALVLQKGKEMKVLEMEERNLLSVAYKNVVGTKRQSWRTLQSAEYELPKVILEKYQKLVEKELNTVCNEVLTLLKEGPVVQAKAMMDSKDPIPKKQGDDKTVMTAEDGVFYLKMCGDYYRYLAEFETDEESHKNNAEDFYGKAMDLAKKELPETHPTRLGLALNFSVCYYEILKKKGDACNLAKAAFDAAIEKLDTLNDASYKDSTLIMQLLRDNLTLWTSENQDAPGGDN